MMHRNLDRRVEALSASTTPALQARLGGDPRSRPRAIDAGAWALSADGKWARKAARTAPGAHRASRPSSSARVTPRMTDANEVELKFAIDGVFALPDLTGNGTVAEVATGRVPGPAGDLLGHGRPAPGPPRRDPPPSNRRARRPALDAEAAAAGDERTCAGGNGVLARREIEMKGGRNGSRASLPTS